jgi:hypothetical protein
MRELTSFQGSAWERTAPAGSACRTRLQPQFAIHPSPFEIGTVSYSLILRPAEPCPEP